MLGWGGDFRVAREAPLKGWHLSKDLKEGGEGKSHGNNGVKTFQAVGVRVQRF